MDNTSFAKPKLPSVQGSEFKNSNYNIWYIVKKKLVNMHLDICGKGHFTVIPLYKFSSDNVVERREKEKTFHTNSQTIFEQ